MSDLAKDGRIPRPPLPGRPHGHTQHGLSRGHAPENDKENCHTKGVPQLNMAEG